MIQFNLLPDVKLEFVKTRRIKRVVTTVAIGIGASTMTIFILLLVVVNVFQSKHLNDLSKDIKRDSSELANTKDLNKVLTIQNQLNSLPELHNNKPVTSRLLGYVTQITPDKVSISQLAVDYELNTLVFTGDADMLSTVNKFIDTMKFTNYQVKDSTEQKKAFSEVVLTSFSLAEANSKAKSASYSASLKFDPVIFNSAQDIQLIVPKVITTRSETEKPTDLFQSTEIKEKP